MIPPKQIGWTVEANLLYQISKQLDHLIRLSCDCSTTSTTSTTSTSTSSTSTTTSTSSTSTTNTTTTLL